jgi:SLOG family YspA-like protein
LRQLRILITGSRTWDDYGTICKTIVRTIGEYVDENPELHFRPLDWVTIVHGACPRGADYLADMFATQVLKCEVERYAADWASFGRSAGFKRNARMVNSAPDVCLAFIRDKSKGSTSCRDLAKRAGIATETIIYDPEKVKINVNLKA